MIWVQNKNKTFRRLASSSPNDCRTRACCVLVTGHAAAALWGAPGPGGGRIPGPQSFEGLVENAAPLQTFLAGVGH